MFENGVSPIYNPENYFRKLCFVWSHIVDSHCVKIVWSHIVDSHCVKIVRVKTCSSQHFPAFGLNTKARKDYSDRMQGNVDQKNSEYGHFSCSVILP